MYSFRSFALKGFFSCQVVKYGGLSLSGGVLAVITVQLVLGQQLITAISRLDNVKILPINYKRTLETSYIVI